MIIYQNLATFKGSVIAIIPHISNLFSSAKYLKIFLIIGHAFIQVKPIKLYLLITRHTHTLTKRQKNEHYNTRAKSYRKSKKS